MDKYDKKHVNKARAWLSTSEGKNSVRNSVKEAKECSKKFKESLQVNPKSLKEPFNI